MHSAAHGEEAEMPLVAQISIVVVAVSSVVITIAALQAMRSLDRAERTIELTAADLRKSMAEISELADRARSILGPLEDASRNVQQTATKFSRLGERIANLSSAVIAEIERPVRSAVATVRGIRTGSGVFVHRLRERFHRGGSHPYTLASNGGNSDA
jgi:uncharacterized protein YoxC